MKVSREGLRQRSVPDLEDIRSTVIKRSGERSYRALRVKLPSQGGTSTFAGALKYLKEELSGGITVCLLYIAVAIVVKIVIIVMNGNYSNRTILDFSTRSFFYLFLKRGLKWQNMQEIIHKSLAGYWQLCFRTATTSGPAHKPARGGNVEARRK